MEITIDGAKNTFAAEWQFYGKLLQWYALVVRRKTTQIYSPIESDSGVFNPKSFIMF